MNVPSMKQPSAFLPLAMSLVITRVLGTGPQTDDMARTRCSFGLTPRTRLNAVLSANGLL